MGDNLNRAFIMNDSFMINDEAANDMDVFDVAPNMPPPAMNATMVANDVRQIPNNNSANGDISMVAVANNNMSTIAPNNNNYGSNRNRNFINIGGAFKKTRRRRHRRVASPRRSRRPRRPTRRTQSRMRHRR
jgi:hypothetical protein